jgi:hypothetical protein
MKQAARQQVLSLARHYEFEEDHSFQDAKLALLLWEQTYDLHGLTAEYADPAPLGTNLRSARPDGRVRRPTRVRRHPA